MKKKLLVLSASAILASNFILDSNASAVVSKDRYESEALKVEGKINYSISVDRYKEHLENLIYSQSLNDFAGYDQPEYKVAYEKYQGRFLAELDAFNKFLLEEKEMEENYKNKVTNYNYRGDKKLFGLTQERYQSIYDALKKNREEFDVEVEKIEEQHADLKRFNRIEKHNAKREVFELEHKALMLPVVFTEHEEARDDMYNKLDMLLGFKKDERRLKEPTNERMLNDIKESLETIIDEFFKDIKHVRPINIPVLTEYNKDNYVVKKQLRDDTLSATKNEKFADPNFLKRAENLQKAKAERDAKIKDLREKGLNKVKKFTPQNYPLYFSHKKLKDHSQSDSKNELVFKETNEQPKELPTYTESITQTPQPVLKQQTRKETFTLESAPRLNQSKPLNGLNGESNLVTIDESANASTQFGSNGHVFEYSFDSTPKTTNVAKQNVKQENYNSVNNLAGMSGESQHVDFTQDSNPSTTYGGYGNAVDFTEDTAPKQPETITESHEIVLDYQTHATMSGFKTGESTEAYYSSNELTK
ncbi:MULTISPECIES: coagulase domain-containing protein [Staphylococcus]|uniref:Coagulase n=1 Tax=Staphylococcus agnetis TaxID=985762 RepID=A0A2T4MHH2_9STAP|nr:MULTISPECIES: coagulase domain-containing protein [Staphylococcus]NHM92742.1 coagulase [Staphylococcus sp. 10602379]NJI01612.1 coagulase [Staphylococcus agnetis]NJI13078.1 coagulase [Staphylococcus agnetis]PTH13953.1 coagulase [Staphylococcus agnetis]PTH28558.1 coagulase [Staphylococcus agnetis]